ncbi:MAG: ribosome recycling factor [Nitrospinae bacterium]|nr:ribosome recycling factor [Nitrospinota bacterium]
MIQALFDELNKKITVAIDHLKKELAGVRTGRASTGLLEDMTVDYYGTQTPINQLATLSVPESSLITVQPWDRTMLQAIEKAILSSSLGLTPANDGNLIRIPIPPLSGERRLELVKHVKKLAEETRVVVRNVRRVKNEDLKKLEKDGKITEDDFHKAHDKIQKITDDYIKKIDQIFAVKEKEIIET